ncbi:MAG: hypothetical protein HWN65_15455 [Candidatus Helarchaeota archaeon]|nr:hypothetical protein [Candidatus Helarchaeota archaeon]
MEQYKHWECDHRFRKALFVSDLGSPKKAAWKHLPFNYVCQKCGLTVSEYDVYMHNVAARIVSDPNMRKELKSRQVRPLHYRLMVVIRAEAILRQIPEVLEDPPADRQEGFPFYVTNAALYKAAQELATLWNLKPLVTTKFLSDITMVTEQFIQECLDLITVIIQNKTKGFHFEFKWILNLIYYKILTIQHKPF